jgi:two-component system, OmpR family, response regulator
MASDHELEALAEQAGVELVAWPAEDGLRQSFARAGVPRLLLVGADEDAPEHVGLDEDWVRVPAELGDVHARLQRLARMVHRLRSDRPVVDANHILHVGGAGVVLSSAQASLVSVLLDHRGRVVDRLVLEATMWPDGAPGPKALDGVVFRLRRRLQGLGLVVRSAHGRGFALDAFDAQVAGPGPADVDDRLGRPEAV